MRLQAARVAKKFIHVGTCSCDLLCSCKQSKAISFYKFANKLAINFAIHKHLFWKLKNKAEICDTAYLQCLPTLSIAISTDTNKAPLIEML